MSKLILPSNGIYLPDAGEVQKFLFCGKWKASFFDRFVKLKLSDDFLNGITNQGKNYILDAGFNAITQIGSTSWYIGLIDGTGTPALASADNLGSHAGWTEFTSYSGNRQAWGQGSASGQALTNASAATFNISATGTLYGIFIASVNTGGTSSNILWSTAAFTSPVPVTNGDQMKCTYTLAT